MGIIIIIYWIIIVYIGLGMLVDRIFNKQIFLVENFKRLLIKISNFVKEIFSIQLFKELLIPLLIYITILIVTIFTRPLMPEELSDDLSIMFFIACIFMFFLLNQRLNIQTFIFKHFQNFFIKTSISVKELFSIQLFKDFLILPLIYIILLLISLKHSSWLLSLEYKWWILPENILSYKIGFLVVMAALILPFFYILSFVRFYFKLIINIPTNLQKLKEYTNNLTKTRKLDSYLIFLIIRIIGPIFLIMMFPTIVFYIIYSMSSFIEGLLDGSSHLLDLKRVIYAISISFPATSISTETISNSSCYDYLSYMQVFLQKLIELLVLSYIVQLIFFYLNNREENKTKK